MLSGPVSDPEARQLVEESEAFLAGRAAALFERDCTPVPLWAYVNEIAHSDPKRVVAAAASITPDTRIDHPRVAMAALAREIVLMAWGDEERIREIQLERLLPLESHLMWFEPSRLLSARGLLALGHARIHAPSSP